MATLAALDDLKQKVMEHLAGHETWTAVTSEGTGHYLILLKDLESAIPDNVLNSTLNTTWKSNFTPHEPANFPTVTYDTGWDVVVDPADANKWLMQNADTVTWPGAIQVAATNGAGGSTNSAYSVALVAGNWTSSSGNQWAIADLTSPLACTGSITPQISDNNLKFRLG